MRRSSAAVLLGGLLVAAPVVLPAATITIVNNDGPGEGFNDPTVVAPVGGNPGTTLGAQRLALFQLAADVWGALLQSDVEIRIEAKFDPLTCDSNGAILGAAGTLVIFRDATGLPMTGTWYSGALANALHGSDLDTGYNDIGARFNSAIDGGCFPGVPGWYYGLDGNVPPDRFGLFSTVLHEFGHGLGFQSFVDETDGHFCCGPPPSNEYPDVYSHFTHDNTAMLHWDEMTNNGRKASAINNGNLVWDGPFATAAVPSFLGNPPLLTIDGGAAAGDYEVIGAAFGAQIVAPGTSGTLEVVNDGSGSPSEGCGALVGFTPGHIAVVDRGTCEFGEKALNAENAGAVAAIVANHVTGGDAIFAMTPGSVGDQVTIPVAMLGYTSGTAIKPTLPQTGTLGVDVGQTAGADGSDHPKLYAPSPVEPGSSISHWDTTASPDLLMEPFDSPFVFAQVDLTIPMFRDLGWTAFQKPTALPEQYPGKPDDDTIVAAPGVLGNDVDNDPPLDLTAHLDSCCSQGGSVVLNADGSFTYTPPGGMEVTDTFTYHASSSAGDSLEVTVAMDLSYEIFSDGFESGDRSAWTSTVP